MNAARKTRIAGLLCGLCVTATACTTDVPDRLAFVEDRCSWRVGPDTPDALRIGAVLSLLRLGKEKDLDDNANARAIELAVNDINEYKGIKGRGIHLTICDKTGDSIDIGDETAAEIAQWLGTQGVHAIVSGSSADTLAIAAATRKQGTLIIARTATSAQITDLDDDGLVWRTAPSDLYQGVVMARVLDQEKAQKVAIVAMSNAYGNSLAKIVMDNAPKSMAVKHYPLKDDPTQAANVVAAVEAQAPDFLVLVTSAAQAKMILEAPNRPALAKARLLLADGLHATDFLNSITDTKRLVGALGTLPGDPFGDVYDTLKQNFLLAFAEDPSQRSYTAHSYDAAWVAILAHAWALKDDPNAAITGTKLAEGMRHLSTKGAPLYKLVPTSAADAVSALLAGKPVDIEGASGPLDFDPKSGEPTSAVEVWKINAAGAFETLHWIRATPDGAGWKYEEIAPK